MLSGFKRLVLSVGLGFVGLSVLLFVIQNPQASQFHFLRWVTPALPLSLMLVLAFILGALTALAFILWLYGRASARLARQRREFRASQTS